MADAYSTNGLQRFCSRACATKSTFNGRSEAKPQLNRSGKSNPKRDVTRKRRPPRRRSEDADIPTAVRAQVMARDGSCRRCGGHRNINLHHICYRSEGVDHQPHNLIALCSTCHAVIHSNKRYWKPICLAYIWLRLVENRDRMLPEVANLVAIP